MATFPHRNFSALAAVVLAAALLAGCSVLSPKPDLARTYRLDALSAKISPAPPPDPTLALAVFPVDVAGYLDRPQMVTVVQGGQVNLDEYHRWAEPLESGFSRYWRKTSASYPIPPMWPLFPWLRALVRNSKSTPRCNNLTALLVATSRCGFRGASPVPAASRIIPCMRQLRHDTRKRAPTWRTLMLQR